MKLSILSIICISAVILASCNAGGGGSGIGGNLSAQEDVAKPSGINSNPGTVTSSPLCDGDWAGCNGISTFTSPPGFDYCKVTSISGTIANSPLDIYFFNKNQMYNAQDYYNSQQFLPPGICSASTYGCVVTEPGGYGSWQLAGYVTISCSQMAICPPIPIGYNFIGASTSFSLTSAGFVSCAYKSKFNEKKVVIHTPQYGQPIGDNWLKVFTKAKNRIYTSSVCQSNNTNNCQYVLQNFPE